MFRQLLRFSTRALSAARKGPSFRLMQACKYSSFKQEDQPRIRIGSTAPNFDADTTQGRINFHEFIGDNWVVLFSHPADFTPVCTTELGAFSQMQPEFEKRGVKLIGLSTEGVESHNEWIKDIEEITTGGQPFTFPIIADLSKEVAFKYDMVTEEDFAKFNSKAMIGTIRAVFVIDPAKKVRLTFVYPASTGRNTAEVLRVIDALQLADGKGIATPVDWTVGQDVIIPPSVTNEEAKSKFGEFKTLKPYLRTTKVN